jgi:hypothetical protein
LQNFANPYEVPVRNILNKEKTRDAPDTSTVFAGYPANLKAGYRMSIWPDISLDNNIFGKI